MMEERVVREAVVEGGRVDGLGREGEAGIRIRRWAASVRGARRVRRAVGKCILVNEGVEIALSRQRRLSYLELSGAESLSETLA
jgi:hypothetical protein